MSVKAEVELEDWDDILDTLQSLTSRNIRFLKKHGPIDLYGGLFVYRLEAPNRCGAERWQTLKQVLRQPQGPPFLVECEEAGTILRALLIATGRDPKAQQRLIQVGPTVHVQVVSKGKVLDPSVRLGMLIPQGLEHKIYDLSFRGIA